MKITTIILAAGKGTRMLSSLPKVLHPIGGKPLLSYAIQAAQDVGTEAPVVIVGHEADEVREAVGNGVRFAVQEPQLGTGHAVQVAEHLVKGKSDLVLVCYADMPMLTTETMQRMVDAQMANEGPVTMLTMKLDDSRGFGRVIRFEDGSVKEIVEEMQASPEQLAMNELNVGVYCFDGDWLWDAIRKIELSPKGEYYLTDMVSIATREGRKVQALIVDDPSEAIGINTRVHLAEAEALLRSRINRAWMLAGVTMVDPATTYIGPDVQIGKDTTIHPNTTLRGSTMIGEGCIIGPHAILDSCKVGDRCVILASVLDPQTIVEDDVDMGPFCHLRKGAHLGKGVHMGNFGEVKNSYLAPGVKMGHFSYVGEANIGKDVNIGAGTITCNYDGKKKYPTEVGDHAFIGSATMLVAPLKIGEGATTGAGSVVNRDVEPGDVVAGVPARSIKKNG